MKRKRVFIFSNGCPRRGMDVTQLIDFFRLNNFGFARTPRKADYIIFVTCGFRKEKEVECYRYIKKLKKCKGELLIAGCLPEIAPTTFKDHFGGKFVSTKEIWKISSLFDNCSVKYADVQSSNFISYSNRFLRTGILALLFKPFIQFELSKNFFNKYLYIARVAITDIIIPYIGRAKLQPASIRIGDGCIENCTYCSIRNAVGQLKSKPLDLCAKEYEKLIKKSYRYFVFHGDNLGAYGLDINSSFAELLQCLSKIDKGIKVKWNLQEINPKWVLKYKDELSKRIKEKKIVCLQCVIQSGSNRILNLMNRGADSGEIAQTLLEFKKINSNLKLETHVIVGFPSETDEEFLETLDLIKKIKFDRVWLFAYSDREDTSASNFPNKLDRIAIERRLSYAKNELIKSHIIWEAF